MNQFHNISRHQVDNPSLMYTLQCLTRPISQSRKIIRCHNITSLIIPMPGRATK
ncbi:hypothetical protein DCAR_0312265 [Daucus carota subsp. sativus]|uniref:Uncharacterized protein n=1 Tax=Daucus carota subsp. sativus TaxID=79200 RepID=A0A166AWW7_DAUCS|nr:hypothetical protein DCAR_0312265 [Daucus carota subsp. sativus]